MAKRMSDEEARARREAAQRRKAAQQAAKQTAQSSSPVKNNKTNFVTPASLAKNASSGKSSASKKAGSSRKPTSYFQPKTSAKSKTVSKGTYTTPRNKRLGLEGFSRDTGSRKNTRASGSTAYTEDYLPRLLSGMNEKDWFLTNAEQALDFRSILNNQWLTGENKLTPSQRLAMKSPLNWAQTNAQLKRSTGMNLAEFNTKNLGSKLTAEEFAKRQQEDQKYWADQAEKAAEYDLSQYDRKLPKTDRERIQGEKMRWDVANSLGDFETRDSAHKMAETIRAKHGYSGGAAGDQKITADITWKDAAALNALNAEGQGKYRLAKLELDRAVKEGNEDRISAAEKTLDQILANPNYRSGAKPGTQNATGHDTTRDTSGNWMDQAAETLKAVGYGVPGSLAFLAETQGQAIDDRVVEENYDYIRSKAAELPTLQARLTLIQRGEGSESWGTEEQIQKQIALAQSMQDLLDSYGQMDQDSLGSQLMAKSQEHAEAALEGTSGLDRILTQTALSMGQNLPGIAANFIPVVGPALGLGLMGAQAAGSRAYDLTQQGVSPWEALSRGLVSGGIEILTEKIPLDNLTKMIRGTSGKSFVKNLLSQMGIEATEESASYTANYLADKIAKDPNAEWSTRELLENAAAGALSGGFFATGGQALGSALNRQAAAPTTPASPGQWQTQADQEAQAREQALEMLTGNAPGPETVQQTERTPQEAAEAPVQALREAAATIPAAAGNTQQAQAGKAQAPSPAAQTSAASKTVKLRRVSGQTQTASPQQTVSPQVRGALRQAQTALLTQMSKTLGTSGEKAMLAAWDNSGDPGQYSAGFVRVYNQALAGTPTGKIQVPASLNDAQVMAAYSAGQNDRKMNLEQAKAAAQQAEVAGKNTALYAAEGGTEAGLVYDSYVKESMDPDTAASLSTMARQLGLRVQMVDSVAGGMANADIQGSVVKIEKNNPNPVRALFGHELTHRVQQLAPESYRAFRDYVMQSGKAQADVQRKIAEYKRAGVKLTTEEAMDEITADYAGEMIEDQDLLKQFIQKNKANQSILRRFLEAVKDMARKLTGKYQKQAEDAVALLEKAVGDAAKQASKLSQKSIESQTRQGYTGSAKYAVKAERGRSIELETMENNRFERLRRFKGELPNEWYAFTAGYFYIYSNESYMDYTILAKARITKSNRADIYRFVEALENGTYKYTETFNRWTSYFRRGKGRYSWDRVRTGDRGAAMPTDGVDGRTRGRDHIGDSAEDSGTGKRFSLKGSDDYNLRKLQAENEMLRERVDYWKGQTKRTERVTTDKKAVAKAARELVRQYGADIDAADIQGELQSLYDYMASGKDGGNELTYSAARERAEGIADKLISHAVEKEDELYQQYSDLRKFLKETKLTVSEADSRGLADYADFRRRNLGHFKLSKGQRTNVDLVYKEMSERWPEFFDEERDGSISDQLYQIEAVLDKVYQITEYNPFGMYTSQAVSGAANEILELFFDLPQTRATFADRQAAKLDREKAAGRRRLQEERERKDAKLEELRQKNRERVDKVIQKERERREKDLGRLKDQYQARDAAGRTRRKERELRAKILRHAKNLSTKLLRPNDKQHIPENLRSAVANVLNSINLESSFELAYGKDAKYHRVKPGDVIGADATKRTNAFQELRLAYENILSEADQQIVVDPDLLANISELEALKDTPLGSLNLSQLTTVWNTLKAVEASISTANKMFGASKFETIREVAEGLKADNGGKRDRGDYRGPIGAMDKLINAGMLTPESYFHRLGKTGQELFRMLRRAQDKHITIMQEAQEYTAGVIGKTNVRKLEKEVHHFDLDGHGIDMTTAQIMSLYELTKRKQAKDHIMVGGIRVDAIDKGIKRTSMSDAVRVTPEQVSEIVSALTEEQIAIADGLQKFMGGRLAELGNEASMEVYGYEKFKEKNYFPIKVDSNQTITDQAKDAAAATIAGRGFTKGTKPHANNAVLIRDIFNVYADHVTDMATYSAWLGAMENLQRVFNFKFRDKDGNVTGTVKGLIHRIFGNNGQSYWKKLTEDLNNGVHGVNDNPFQALIGNYKASAIGANIRVFIQQPTSILRALDTISPGDFAAGLVKANPRTWSKVKKYAPIAVWKDWGYFDADTGRQMKSVLFGDDSKLAKVNNFFMAPAGAMDSLAWSHVWNALEVETGRKHKDLEKGSDAFYQKVAERFNEVVDHSQVVDGVLQRSQVMRSADGVTKMATSFMAEPTKIFNMFTTAAYDLRKSQDHAVRRQARKTMARTSVALIISFVANAAAQSLVDALRDDDKDEEYWEKFFQAFTGLEGDEESKLDSFKSVVGGNMVSAFNPFTYIPFLKDVVSLAEGYDVTRMDMEPISKFLQSFAQCYMSFFGDGKMTKTNAIINLISEGSRILGVPVSNLKRDVVAVINTWLNRTHNYRGQYEVTKFLYRIENKSNRDKFLDIAYLAWRDGDKDTFLTISQDLMDTFGEDVNGETIESAMRKRMEDQMEEDDNFQADQTLMDLVGLLPVFEEEEEEEAEFSAKNLNAKQYEQYSTQRAASYREYENAVTSNPVWATLDDEAKDKVISAMWKYAGQTALEEASDGEFTITESSVLKARAVAESGVDVGTFFIMKGVADAQDGVKTVDDVTISDSASYNKLKALRNSGLMDSLSEDQKTMVYEALEVSAKVRSMSDDALDKLGSSIEEAKNAPSVYSILGEDKTEFVQEFYETCSGFSTSYDGNGKEIKGQGRQDKIIAEIKKYSNLTRAEKSALYHMFYESDKNNPWA